MDGFGRFGLHRLCLGLFLKASKSLLADGMQGQKIRWVSAIRLLFIRLMWAPWIGLLRFHARLYTCPESFGCSEMELKDTRLSHSH